MTMRLLVTGAAGFIGTNFCFHAVKRGHRLLAVDNLSNPKSRARLSLLKQAGIPLRNVDIRNPLPRSLKPLDAIIHLAAHCSTPKSFLKPDQDFLDNALGTVSVLEFARKHGKIPLIYASTIKVYPDSVNDLPRRATKTRYELTDREGIDETFPIEPGVHSPYGASKYVGDLYCQEYFASFGVPTVVNRLSTVFGPHQHGSQEAGWISHFIAAKKSNRPVTIYGSGKQVRDALWVNDFCDLLLTQIKHLEKAAGNIYNVGGGKENALSLLELVDYLDSKGGKPLKVRFKEVRPSDLTIFICDLTKVRGDLGWQPTTGVWTGIDKLYQHILSNNAAR